MRKKKDLKLDDREITVKELTVREILEVGNELSEQVKGEDFGLDLLKKALGKHFSKAIDGLTLESLLELAPSEIDLVYKAFKEVNKVFFVVVDQMGLGELLKTLKEAAKKDFLNLLAG